MDSSGLRCFLPNPAISEQPNLPGGASSCHAFAGIPAIAHFNEKKGTLIKSVPFFN